jgi:hypothetical protein
MPETRTPIVDTAPDASRASESLPRCKACATVAPAGAKNCTSCGRFLPANRAAEVHGVVTAERRNTLPEEIRDSARAFFEQGLADLGGVENISRIELGQLQNLTRVFTKIEQLDAYLVENGPLTPRGRLRSSVAAFNAAVALYSQLAKQLGFSRRVKKVQRTIEDWVAEHGDAAEEQPEHANG